MKILNIIICIISALPILAYPVVLAAAVMIFDAPGSGNSFSNWLYASVLILYPVFIIICIILALTFNSTWLACLGLLPLLFSYQQIVLNTQLKYKKKFETTQREYVCNEDAYLVRNKFGDMSLYEKREFLKYIIGSPVAYLHDSILIANNFLPKDSKMTTQEYLMTCKNKEGKTVAEQYGYTVMSEDSYNKEYTWDNETQKNIKKGVQTTP